MIGNAMRLYLFALCVLSAGCSGKAGDNASRSISTGPDAFLVVPNKALQTPASFDDLPTPGAAANRADVDPINDAIQALGGRQGRTTTANAALNAHIAQFDASDEIRAILREEHAQNSRGLRSFAARDFALDAFGEFERLRALGVAVPSAPPQ